MRNEIIVTTAFVLAVGGVWLFGLGFHSVDLATHFYYANCIDGTERSLLIDSNSIDSVYMQGISFFVIGFVMSSSGFLFFGYWAGKTKYGKWLD
jgi:hypothetical protein